VYFDQDQLYNQNITYYKNSTYLTQDNSQVLEREIEFPMVSDIRNIGYLSRQILNQSRFGMVINFTSSYTALQVEIGDVVRITLDNVGFVDKLFRVMALGLNVDGTIQLTAMEYDDSLFTTGTLPEIPLPGTIIPEAGSSLFTSVVAPPSGVTATATAVTQADGSTLSTIAVNWTAATTAPSTYEIVLSGTSSAIFVTGGSTTTYSISGLPNGTYNVAVRAVNAFGNKSTLVF
jgi:predicted phage tail protein